MAGALLPLAIGLSAATSIPNWVAAFNQDKLAKSLEGELERPAFEIPQAEKDSLQSAKNQASMTRLPGADAITGQIQQSTANSLDAVERMGPGGATNINAAGMAYANEQSKLNELGIAGSNMWLHNQDVLRNEQNQMAQWENKAWEWDKAQPYLAKADAIRSLKEGSMRNFDNAFKDLFGGASNIALGAYLNKSGSSDWAKILESLNGGGAVAGAGENADPSFYSEPGVETNVSNSTGIGNNWLWDFNKTSPIMSMLMPKNN